MNNKTFAVVSFINEQGSLFVVPSTWLIDESSCRWPPFISDKMVVKAVTSLEKACDTWAIHDIRVLYSTDTYEKACLKLKIAEDTSDLQTESEQQPARLRTKRKTIDYNIDTPQIMSDNDIEFNVPKIIKKSHFPKKDLQSAPFVPLLMLQQSMSSMSEDVFEVSSNKTTSNETQCLLSQDVSEKLVTLLMEIKSEINGLKRQAEFNTKMLQQMLECKGENDILEKYSFPIDNLEELCEIEKLLAADKAVFNKLVIAVASKGGQTLKEEAVRRMSFTLFTNNLCCKIKWTGITRNDNESIFVKQSLKDLQCQHVLEKAVKRNPATTSATESDFQHEVVRFLRGASDRNGGQNVRQDQKNKQAKKKLMPTSSFPMPLNKEAFFSSEDE